MGFNSQSGFVGFKTQAVKGTFVNPGAASPNQGVYVRSRSGSLGGNRDLLIPDPEIGGNRDVPDAQLGPISFAGEFDVYMRMEEMFFFLKACLGTVATAGPASTTVYTHTITPNDGDIPWVSVDEQVGDGYLNFNYQDAKINTFHLEADANGYLMGTVGVVALTQVVDATPTSPTGVNTRWDNSTLLTGTTVTVDYGGVALPAKSFSLDINNNLETDDFRLGSLFLGNIVAKRREMTMGVTIRPDDASLWKQATWGSPTATVPGGSSFKDDASVTITSYDDIPGSTAPTVKYSATFTIPSAIIAPYTATPSGDDVLQHDLEIRCVRPDPTVKLVTIVGKSAFVTVP